MPYERGGTVRKQQQWIPQGQGGTENFYWFFENFYWFFRQNLFLPVFFLDPLQKINFNTVWSEVFCHNFLAENN